MSVRRSQRHAGTCSYEGARDVSCFPEQPRLPPRAPRTQVGAPAPGVGAAPGGRCVLLGISIGAPRGHGQDTQSRRRRHPAALCEATLALNIDTVEIGRIRNAAVGNPSGKRADHSLFISVITARGGADVVL